jgi:plasmid rolling circle replication initiator protein Rep
MSKDTQATVHSQAEDYASRKKANEKTLGYIQKHVSPAVYMRMETCMDWYRTMADVNFEHPKIYRTFRCTNRFCPICAYGQACRDAFQMSLLIPYVCEVQRKELLMLTLTSPNVKAVDLKDAIRQYNRASKAMLRQDREGVGRLAYGYIRKLEVTYNSESYITSDMWHGNPGKKIKPQGGYFARRGLEIGDPNPNYDTYHPHFHVVLAVSGEYVEQVKANPQRESARWLAAWQKAMKDPSITQVDIRPVRDTQNSNAVLEMAKYTAKPSDMLHSETVFDTFYTALKGCQVITFGGVFKDACTLYKEYVKLEPAKRKKHVLHRFVEPDETEYVYGLLYEWSKGCGYIEKECQELTKEEMAEMGIYNPVDEL